MCLTILACCVTSALNSVWSHVPKVAMFASSLVLLQGARVIILNRLPHGIYVNARRGDVVGTLKTPAVDIQDGVLHQLRTAKLARCYYYCSGQQLTRHDV